MSRYWLFLLVLVAPMYTAPLGAAAQSRLAGPPAPHPATAQPEKPAAKPKSGAKPVPVVQPDKSARPERQAHRPAPPPPAPAAPPAPEPAPAPTPEEPAKGSVTGLKLPRFAALRSDDINLRAGPGTRYQIEWVYHRRDLPVQIEREFEVWRLVSDMDGVKGWVHEATLTGRRTFMTRADDQTLRRSPADTAAAVAVLKAGVVGRILSCADGAEWCEVQAGGYRGYLRRTGFWGTFPGEAVGN